MNFVIVYYVCEDSIFLLKKLILSKIKRFNPTGPQLMIYIVAARHLKLKVFLLMLHFNIGTYKGNMI